MMWALTLVHPANRRCTQQTAKPGQHADGPDRHPKSRDPPADLLTDVFCVISDEPSPQNDVADGHAAALGGRREPQTCTAAVESFLKRSGAARQTTSAVARMRTHGLVELARVCAESTRRVRRLWMEQSINKTTGCSR
jgi:hypothetical protein